MSRIRSIMLLHGDAGELRLRPRLDPRLCLRGGRPARSATTVRGAARDVGGSVLGGLLGFGDVASRLLGFGP